MFRRFRQFPQIGGKRKHTARDYVQDGLIAMWDGIENAGWGVHDAESVVWKDLSGNGHDATLTTRGSFGDDCLIKQSGGAGATAALFDWKFVEIVFASSNGTAVSIILFAGSSTAGKIVWSKGKLGQTYYGSCAVESLGNRLSYATRNAYAEYNYLNGEISENKGSPDAWSGRNGIYVGGRDDATASHDGEFCCIRFYSRYLTDGEVAANYAVDKERFGLE